MCFFSVWVVFTGDGPVSCDFGSFACDNGQCISESLLCDGTGCHEKGAMLVNIPLTNFSVTGVFLI